MSYCSRKCLFTVLNSSTARKKTNEKEKTRNLQEEFLQLEKEKLDVMKEQLNIERERDYNWRRPNLNSLRNILNIEGTNLISVNSVNYDNNFHPLNLLYL